MFKQMDLKGKSAGQARDDTQLKTIHQNTINTVRFYEVVGGKQRFSSELSIPV